MRITPSSDVFRALQGLKIFSSPGAVPGAVPLEPADTLLGVLACNGSTAAVLLDLGAYLKFEDEWYLVPYDQIEVQLPATEVPPAPLVLTIPQGRIEILAGTPEAREAGRFFVRCAEKPAAV